MIWILAAFAVSAIFLYGTFRVVDGIFDRREARRERAAARRAARYRAWVDAYKAGE